MSKQSLSFKCPFCNKGKIDALYFPSVKNYIGGPHGVGKKLITHSKEDLIVENDCPVCGKNHKEIKKAYEKGKVKSHEERIKRIMESGLPTMVVSKR